MRLRASFTRVALAVVLVVLGYGEVLGQESARRVTLEEALRMAEVNNPSLEQSASSVEIARYQELTAWGQFLPDLALSYQFSDASSGRLDPTGSRRSWPTPARCRSSRLGPSGRSPDPPGSAD